MSDSLEEDKNAIEEAQTGEKPVEEFVIESCLSVASSPLPAALHVKVFDKQLVFEAAGMRSGKKITFDKLTNELQVGWPQRNPLNGTITDDPDPLIISLENIQKIILGRDEPGGNPLIQDFSVKIEENGEIEELLAGDSRLLRVAQLISNFTELELGDETQIEPSEYGFEIPLSDNLPEISKIEKQDKENVTSLFWVDKGNLVKYWGYFTAFTLFYAIVVYQFFSKDFFQLGLAFFLWFFIFRMVLSLPKVFYSKIAIAPSYISLKRTPNIGELDTMLEIPSSHIKSIRVTMVTNNKPGLEVVTERAIHWIGYDISLSELGYLYSLIRTKMEIEEIEN